MGGPHLDSMLKFGQSACLECPSLSIVTSNKVWSGEPPAAVSESDKYLLDRDCSSPLHRHTGEGTYQQYPFPR